jgi:hypothetical protein
MLQVSKYIFRQSDDTDAVLVDISNVRDDQLRQMERKGKRLVFISTNKTFNYKESKARMPRAAVGTLWFVLRVPSERENGKVSEPYYDGHRFKYKRSRDGSPHLRYHHKKLSRNEQSVCSISDARGRSLTLEPSHTACEIDDIIILHLSQTTQLEVFSNDKRLMNDVSAGRMPRPDRAMQTLLSVTKVATLVKTRSGWKEDQND